MARPRITGGDVLGDSERLCGCRGLLCCLSVGDIPSSPFSGMKLTLFHLSHLFYRTQAHTVQYTP